MKRVFCLLFALGLAISARANVVMEEVLYRDGDVLLKGFMAYDNATKEKRPGIFVLPEFWGMSWQAREYAQVLAAAGYTAFAVDMYGKVAADPKEASDLMGSVMGAPALMKSRFAAAKEVLVNHPTVDAKRLGAIGFSMGSSVALDMARAGENLAGVVSVYGSLGTKTPAQAGKTKTRVLVLHARGDAFVDKENIEAFHKEMKTANVNYRFVEYPGVKHGWANPEATVNGKRFDMPIAYNADADKKTREQAIRFFGEVFAKK